MRVIINKRIVWIAVYVLVCALAFGAGRAFTAHKKSKTTEIFIAGAKLGYLMAIKDLQSVYNYSVPADYLVGQNDVYDNASRYLYTNYKEGGFNGKQIEQDIKEVSKQIEGSFR